ncbi:hypothetical protein LTR91_025136, partial [Friedmanniomyces endolithicus]
LINHELAFVRGAILRVSHSAPRQHTASVGWPCSVRLYMQNRTAYPSPTLAVRLAAVQQRDADAAAVGFTGSRTRVVNPIAAGATVWEEFVVSVTMAGRVRLVGTFGPDGFVGRGMERWTARLWVEFEAVEG